MSNMYRAERKLQTETPNRMAIPEALARQGCIAERKTMLGSGDGPESLKMAASDECEYRSRANPRWVPGRIISGPTLKHTLTTGVKYWFNIQPLGNRKKKTYPVWIEAKDVRKRL
jgi:hypothetical protein